MRIQYYGHSCFLITTDSGMRILTDPCDPTTGYTLKNIRCDCVTVSHSHFDHSYTDAACGSPAILESGADLKIGDMRIYTVKTFHDDKEGELRGENAVFCFETDGLRFVHLGDFGEAELRDETAEAIGQPDILFIPVGGTFTVDAAGALAVAEKLNPKLLIPMHYMTDVLSFKIAGITTFLKAAGTKWKKDILNLSHATVSKETLPEKRTILVLDYLKK